MMAWEKKQLVPWFPLCGGGEVEEEVVLIRENWLYDLTRLSNIINILCEREKNASDKNADKPLSEREKQKQKPKVFV